MIRACVICGSPFDVVEAQGGQPKMCSDVCRKRRVADATAEWRKRNPEDAKDAALRSKLRHKHRRARQRISGPVGVTSPRLATRVEKRQLVFEPSVVMASKPIEWDDPYAQLPTIDVSDIVARTIVFGASITSTPSRQVYAAELGVLDRAVDDLLRRPSKQREIAARQKLAVARRTGRLVPGKCVAGPVGCCGRIEGHHEDYSRPLDITWLCKTHHAARHSELRRALKVAA